MPTHTAGGNLERNYFMTMHYRATKPSIVALAIKPNLLWQITKRLVWVLMGR